MALGVIPEDKMAALLEAGFSMAARAASNNDTKAWKRVMDVAVMAARLEQTAATPQVNQQQNLQVNLQVVMQQLSDDELRAISKLDSLLEDRPGDQRNH
jgi:diketogulonate reductase-like aldo/keto reductase